MIVPILRSDAASPKPGDLERLIVLHITSSSCILELLPSHFTGQVDASTLSTLMLLILFFGLYLFYACSHLLVLILDPATAPVDRDVEVRPVGGLLGHLVLLYGGGAGAEDEADTSGREGEEGHARVASTVDGEERLSSVSWEFFVGTTA